MKVRPAWQKGLGGLLNRLAVAEAIEAFLNDICKRKRAT
jgi:hypothetical protein